MEVLINNSFQNNDDNLCSIEYKSIIDSKVLTSQKEKITNANTSIDALNAFSEILIYIGKQYYKNFADNENEYKNSVDNLRLFDLNIENKAKEHSERIIELNNFKEQDIKTVKCAKKTRIEEIDKQYDLIKDKKARILRIESDVFPSLKGIVDKKALKKCREIKEKIVTMPDLPSMDEIIKELNDNENEIIKHVNQYYDETVECCNKELELYCERQKRDKVSAERNAKTKYELSLNYMNDEAARALETVLCDKEIISKFLSYFEQRICFNDYKFIDYDVLPEYYDLGFISMEIPMEIIETDFLHMQYDKYCVEWKKERLISSDNFIRIPMIVSRRQGYSIVLPCLNVDDITSFILRNSMMFPVGKMMFTTICAPTADVFGPLHSIKRQELFLTGGYNYRQADAIERKISEINEHVNYVNNNFFKNAELRERMVPFQTLLIYDYDNGINEKAKNSLKDMIDFAPQNGVNIVFFCDDPDSVDRRVWGSSLVVKKHEGRYGGSSYSVNFNNQEYKYELGEVLEAPEYLKIINSISEHVGEKSYIKYTLDDLIPDWKEINSFHIGGNSSVGIDIPVAFVGNSKFHWVIGKSENDKRHHTLIYGQTGSGKTELLHAILLSLFYKYSSDEVQVCLMDYKEGVGEQYFKGISHIRKIIAQGDREAGCALLEEMVMEMNNRYEEYKKYKTDDISKYRAASKKNSARIIIVIDELSGLSGQNDNISKKVIECISQIAERGRAAGIHLLLTAQTFENTGITSEIDLNFAHRFHCVGYGMCEYTQFDNNKDDQHKITLDTVFVEKNIPEFLINLSMFNPISFSIDNKIQTKIISKEIGDHTTEILNSFVIDNDDKKNCIISVGYNTEDDDGEIVLSASNSSLLVVCPENSKAGGSVSDSCNLFTYVILSIMQNGLAKYDLSKEKKYISLFAIEPAKKYKDELQKTRECFADYVQYIFADGNEADEEFDGHINKIKSLIDETYSLYLKRKSEEIDSDVPRYLMVYGLHRLEELKHDNRALDINTMMLIGNTEKNYLKMLEELIIHGGESNIYVIAWTDANYGKISSKFGITNIFEIFSTVLASGMGEKMEELVNYSGDKADSETYAVIKRRRRNVGHGINLFRMPSNEWIDDFCMKCRRFIKE